jgi:hypothetical protein
MNKSNYFALIGSTFLIIGVFIPYVRVLVLEKQTYNFLSLSFFQISPICGSIILILASLGLIEVIILKTSSLSLFAGIGSLGISVVWVIISHGMERFSWQKLIPHVGWLYVRSWYLSLGPSFLIIGSLLMLISALIKRKE